MFAPFKFAPAVKFAAALLALVFLSAPMNASAEAPFTLQSTWKLGGDGSWDYMTVDAKAHLLYIARLNRIMVVDLVSGKLVTEIAGLNHAHGIAFDADGKVGYISDGGAGTVLVFDRASYKILATIPVGKNPDAVLFEPTRKRVFAFNGISHNATVIDAMSNKVIATVPMPGKPEFSVTDGAGGVFVNIEDTSAVLRLDAATLKVTATWPLTPGKGPSGLAIDPAGHRLFSVCDNDRMVVLDAATGNLVAAPHIGEGADAVAYDGARGLVFSSNGESGTMSIVQRLPAGGYAVLQTLPTKLGARTMAVDSSTGRVYTVSSSLGPKPPASASNPKRRPEILPDSFVVLGYGR